MKQESGWQAMADPICFEGAVSREKERQKRGDSERDVGTEIEGRGSVWIVSLGERERELTRKGRESAGRK